MASGRNFHFQLQGENLLGITRVTTDEYVLRMNTIKQRKQEQTEGLFLCHHSPERFFFS